MKSKSKKELLFSVTAADCEWSYTRGTGKGGQNINKCNSAVHCIHRPSGAHGYSQESRSQLDNKRSAFRKMAETKEFKHWHKLETAKRLGQITDIEEKVKQEMNNIKVEVKEGKVWKEVDKHETLDDMD